MSEPDTPKTATAEPPNDNGMKASGPREALLNAAIVNLDFARQYLDKFLNWFDYLVATHYNAVALSLRPASRARAQECFEEVASSLNRDGLPQQGAVNGRIRSEAIYNRGVLMMCSGDLAGAKIEFQRLFRSIGFAVGDEAPRGVRFAAEFAVILIEQSKSTAAPSPEFAPKRELFLEQVRAEITRIETEIATAESLVSGLEPKVESLERAAAKDNRDEKKTTAELAQARKRLKDAQSALTKLSKDRAILRSMRKRLGAAHDTEPSADSSNPTTPPPTSPDAPSPA
jgi:hypothetical protein